MHEDNYQSEVEIFKKTTGLNMQMHITLKSKIFIVVGIISLLATLTANSQQNNRLYATIEDYKNNKPIEGYELVENSWDCRTNFETFKVLRNGVVQKMKLTELPSELYTYDSTLIRTFAKACATVLVEGTICVYLYKCTGYDLWISEGITGGFTPLYKFKYKGLKFEELLKQYNLFDSYKKELPKREFRDNPSSYKTKLAKRDIYYIKLLNEKLAVN